MPVLASLQIDDSVNLESQQPSPAVAPRAGALPELNATISPKGLVRCSQLCKHATLKL